MHINNYIPFLSCDYFLQPDWNALYVQTPGQGSVTLLTGPFLTRARRGLGTRLGSAYLGVGSLHSDAAKTSTWEWALAQDTMVYMYINLSSLKIIYHNFDVMKSSSLLTTPALKHF